MLLTVVIAVLVLWLVIDRVIRHIKVKGLDKKHVFITGCDSGFGRDLAIQLDNLGVPVFAACLTENGLQTLAKITSSRLRKLRLDVSNHESIRDAEKFVRENIPDGEVLWAVVNNAGVTGPMAPLEMCTREEVRETCDVNLFGPIEVARVFLPLLRKSRGRVVSIGSVMGRCTAVNMPYSASKFGMEAFADVLRREVAPFGIKVSLLEPGFHRTPLLDLDDLFSKVDLAFKRSTAEVQTAYGGAGFVDRSKALITATIDGSSKETFKVVDAYVEAITSCYPRPRYVVGWDAKLVFVPLSFLPEWVGDFVLSSIMKFRLREQGFAP